MTTDEILLLSMEILTITLQWVAIPLILVGLVVMGRSLVTRTRNEERQTAARAGWWAGLILFFLYFVHQLPAFRAPGPGVEGGIMISVWGVVIGVGLGFVLLWGLSFLSAARVVGFLVLLLTFAGLASLHSYLFLEIRGEGFIGGTLGMALGGLVHTMVFPDSLFKTEKKEEKEPGVYEPPRAGSRRY